MDHFRITSRNNDPLNSSQIPALYQNLATYRLYSSLHWFWTIKIPTLRLGAQIVVLADNNRQWTQVHQNSLFLVILPFTCFFLQDLSETSYRLKTVVSACLISSAVIHYTDPLCTELKLQDSRKKKATPQKTFMLNTEV